MTIRLYNKVGIGKNEDTTPVELYKYLRNVKFRVTEERLSKQNSIRHCWDEDSVTFRDYQIAGKE